MAYNNKNINVNSNNNRSITTNSTKKEITTKDKILNVAIDLFSTNGYNEVSIREIAKEVGIKDASIYYHYSKKEDILDSIFEYFIERMNRTGTSEEHQEELLNKSPMDLYHFGSESVKYQFSSIKMIKIMRLIFIELYHNEKIRDFFQKKIIDEPITFWTLLFQQFIDKKIIKHENPRQLTENYYNYAMYKMFESILLKYPDDPNEIDLNPIFDNIEQNFYFILDSTSLKDKNLIENKNKYKYKNRNKIEIEDKYKNNSSRDKYLMKNRSKKRQF